MSDEIFENPRLVAIYDYFDGQRRDLDQYVALAKELKAKSVLDVGSGTGTFACLLAAEGFSVTGLEPAAASIELARRKQNAEHVRWILGDATALPSMQADLAVMTGNVAQVFLTDESWEKTLVALRKVISPNGHLVFEARDPAKKAWLEWTREKTRQRITVPTIGGVEGWCDVIDVSIDLVRFRWTYVFESDGQTITSDSTIRFRQREVIEQSLARTGFNLKEVRDAPDRPGKELIFMAALA